MKCDDFADLLSGAKAIAGYTGENYRQTVYKLSTKQLPGWKIGAVWYARSRRFVPAILVRMGAHE